MICSKEQCTGCGACYNICPTKSITMEFDDNGFITPVISDRCIKCGLCEKTCPVLKKPNIQRIDNPQAYALRNKDVFALKSSTSGGAFSVFANAILKQKGVVFGAVTDENFIVRIKSAESIDDIIPMRFSKYVQSLTGDTYSQAKFYLKSGRKVLYTGLPCQIAGLYGYLGCDNENLITIDIVCHGTPSSILFTDYINYTGKELGSKIIYINQRDKSKEWTKLIQCTELIKTANGKSFYRDYSKDPYLVGFLSGLSYRKSCYQCKFASMPRISDITIGDFFGLGVIEPYNNYCKDGISQVIINSKKGLKIFENNKEYVIFDKRSLRECLSFNFNLWKPSHRNPRRDEFYNDYQKLSFEELRRKYLDKNIKFKIKNILKSTIKKVLGPHYTAKGMLISYKVRGIQKKIDVVYKNLNANVKD